MDFREFLQRQLEDREFAELWEDTLPSFEAGTLLVEIRSQLTLSQRALAERAGVKRSYISRLESGDANPTVRTLGRILRAVGFRLRLGKELIAAPMGTAAEEPPRRLFDTSYIDPLYAFDAFGGRWDVGLFRPAPRAMLDNPTGAFHVSYDVSRLVVTGEAWHHFGYVPPFHHARADDDNIGPRTEERERVNA